jgi:hypothetical protein
MLYLVQSSRPQKFGVIFRYGEECSALSSLGGVPIASVSCLVRFRFPLLRYQNQSKSIAAVARVPKMTRCGDWRCFLGETRQYLHAPLVSTSCEWPYHDTCRGTSRGHLHLPASLKHRRRPNVLSPGSWVRKSSPTGTIMVSGRYTNHSRAEHLLSRPGTHAGQGSTTREYVRQAD